MTMLDDPVRNSWTAGADSISLAELPARARQQTTNRLHDDQLRLCSLVLRTAT